METTITSRCNVWSCTENPTWSEQTIGVCHHSNNNPQLMLIMARHITSIPVEGNNQLVIVDLISVLTNTSLADLYEVLYATLSLSIMLLSIALF